MAIPSAAGFNIGSSDPIDDRLVLTKEQMLGINENTMPDVYFANCSDDGNIYVYNKDNTKDPETGKFRKVASDSVVEVDELPEVKERLIYNLTAEKTRYEDLGTLEVEQHGEQFVGELFVNTNKSFTLDVNGTEYEITPAEEVTFLFGTETEMPALAYILYGDGTRTRFLALDNKETSYVFKKVIRNQQTKEVWSKDRKLVTQEELDNMQMDSVVETEALPEEKENVVYKVQSKESATLIDFLPMGGKMGMPEGCYAMAFYVPKENILHIDNVLLSYDGFATTPKWTKSEDGEYSYLNIEENGTELNVTDYPAAMIYRETHFYTVMFISKTEKGHYFETDAEPNWFKVMFPLSYNESTVVGENYDKFIDYNNKEYSLESSFDTGNYKWDATTRTFYNNSGSSGYFSFIAKKLNPITTNSFTLTGEMGEQNLKVIDGRTFESDNTNRISVGDIEFTTNQNFEYNFDESSGIIGLPALVFALDSEGFNTMVVYEKPENPICIKTDTQKMWINFTMPEGVRSIYIPECITRICSHYGDENHSTSESFVYTHDHFGFSYDADTRILTDTSTDNYTEFFLQIPASISGVNTSGVKIYAKDEELTTQSDFKDFKGEYESFKEEILNRPVEKIQYTSIPTEAEFGKIIQYIGSTTEDFTNGFFYKYVVDSQSKYRCYKTVIMGVDRFMYVAPNQTSGKVLANGDLNKATSKSQLTESEYEIQALTDDYIQIIGVEGRIYRNRDSDLGTNWIECKVNEIPEDITDLIPAQASKENQLADKNFVNSSVATNTANYKGNFDDVSNLPTEGVTNNDFAYVTSVDMAGNTIYARYKYNSESSEWKFEYNLNNTGFTAEQFAAINSGITAKNYGGTSAKATADGNGNNIAETYLPKNTNSEVLPQFEASPSFLLGIEAFNDGGTVKWQTSANIKVGESTKATQDADGNDIRNKYLHTVDLGSKTIDEVKTYTNTSGAFCGSASISNGPAGNCWYNVLWIPHRNGIGDDNPNYGQLFLYPMTVNSATFYRYQKNSNVWTGPFSYSYASGSASNADLNTYKTPGNWRITSGSNLPPNMNSQYGQLLVLAGDTSDWITQIFSVEGDDNNDLWYRKWIGDGFSSWMKVLTKNNFSYSNGTLTINM